MTDIVIRVTNEQRQRIEEQAHQHGFETLSDYLLSLIEGDAPTKEDLLTRFREGWAAAMNEDTIPVSKLREFLDGKE